MAAVKVEITEMYIFSLRAGSFVRVRGKRLFLARWPVPPPPKCFPARTRTSNPAYTAINILILTTHSSALLLNLRGFVYHCGVNRLAIYTIHLYTIERSFK